MSSHHRQNVYVFEDLLENKIHRFHYSPLEKHEKIPEEERIDALDNQTKFRNHLYHEYKQARTQTEKDVLKKQMHEVDFKIRDLLMSFHLEKKKMDEENETQ